MSEPEAQGGSERRLPTAVGRGFRGRCPACGKGRLLVGYLSPAASCSACGEALASYRTADFVPYLVTFAIGLIFMPLAVVLSRSQFSAGFLVGGLALGALASAFALLPPMKGAAIALLWALDVRSDPWRPG